MTGRKKRRKPVTKEILVDPTLPVIPTEALPGSREKVEILRKRYRARQLLHVEGDVTDDPEHCLALERMRNGFDVLPDEGEEECNEVRPEPEEKKGTVESTDTTGEKVGRVGDLTCVGSLGDAVMKFRTGRGWSFGQMAMISGLGRGHIQNIEAGRRKNVQASTIKILASLMGVSVEMLLRLT